MRRSSVNSRAIPGPFPGYSGAIPGRQALSPGQQTLAGPSVSTLSPFGGRPDLPRPHSSLCHPALTCRLGTVASPAEPDS